MGDDLAALRHAAGQGGDQPGGGVDGLVVHVVGDQRHTQGCFEVLQWGAGVDLVEAAGTGRDLVDLRLVVLVVDLADHRFEHVLKGDEAIDAAELVDDHGHVDAAGLHAHQEVGGAHGGRHVERLALEAGEHCAVRLGAHPRLGDQQEDILEVSHADRIIEGFAVDRQS